MSRAGATQTLITAAIIFYGLHAAIRETVEKRRQEIWGFTTTSSSPAWSTSWATSNYASASSLRDLVDSSEDDEDDPDEVIDAIIDDEMFDTKAESKIGSRSALVHS